MRVSPIQHVSTPGSRAEFTCVAIPSTGVVNVQWLLNGTVLERNSSNITIHYVGPGIGQLIFCNLSLERNMTVIGCRAIYDTNRHTNSTNVAVLLLQG